MDKQNLGVGGIVVFAIAMIVGAILLQASAQNISSVVNTVELANVSLGEANNGTTLYLADYKAISSVVIYNETTSVVDSGEYTVTGNVVNNGALSISVEPSSPASSNVTGNTWFISGTAQESAYGDSAGRSVTALIVIMMALAMLAVAVGYAVKNKLD